MNRVARTRDGRELQGKTVGHDVVGVWHPVEEWPTVLPPQIAVRSRSQQRFMNRAGYLRTTSFVRRSPAGVVSLTR
jgi:hypothetical protein